MDGTRLLGNGTGLFADANSRVTVRDSVAAGSNVGFDVWTAGVLNLENCLTTDNNDASRQTAASPASQARP